MCKAEFTVNDFHVIQIITVTSAFLSTIGSLATLTTFFIFNKKSSFKWKQSTFLILRELFTGTSFSDSFLVFWLAIADCISSIWILLQQLMLLSVYPEYNISVCQFFRGIIQYFVLSTFCWTSCISFELHQQVSLQQQSESYVKKKYLIYHLVSWGLPLVIVVSLSISGELIVFNKAEWCHPHELYHWLFWLTPIIVSLAWNSVFYILIIRSFKKMSESFPDMDKDNYKIENNALEKLLSLYLLVFVFCWIWDFIYHIASSAFKCNMFVMWIIANLFAPMQGFLNFLVYGLLNRMISVSYLSPQPSPSASENDPFLYSGSNSHNKNSRKTYD